MKANRGNLSIKARASAQCKARAPARTLAASIKAQAQNTSSTEGLRSGMLCAKERVDEISKHKLWLTQRPATNRIQLILQILHRQEKLQPEHIGHLHEPCPDSPLHPVRGLPHINLHTNVKAIIWVVCVMCSAMMSNGRILQLSIQFASIPSIRLM